MNSYRILAINPGSTSTKIAVFDGEQLAFLKNISHSSEELSVFENIPDQYQFRKDAILRELSLANIEIDSLNAVVGRGGLLKPIESGIYEVNEAMKQDLRKGIQGQHASNLGGLIADDIAHGVDGVKAYIADPVVVDELCDVARITGLPELPRTSIFHALNQKAVARAFARTRGFVYEELNLIVAHVGGGVSIGAHKKGRVIEVNNGLDGYGPISAERAGMLPLGKLVDMCYSGEYTHQEVRRKLVGKGGMVAHLGTNSAYEVTQRMQQGDKHAKLIFDAMCYQIGQSIGACAAVLEGKVNGIILTGGVANSNYLVEYVRKMVDFIAPVAIHPGEDEMTSLASITLLALKGKVECKVYS